MPREKIQERGICFLFACAAWCHLRPPCASTTLSFRSLRPAPVCIEKTHDMNDTIAVLFLLFIFINHTLPMRVFVAGSTGATGKHVVKMLLQKGDEVVAVVRSQDKLNHLLPADVTNKYKDNLKIHQVSLLDLSDDQLQNYTKGCHAVVSCLGHTADNLFGEPKRLVTDATRRLTNAMPGDCMYLLMGTAMVRTPQDPPKNLSARFFIWCLNHILPPHQDNEAAAEYLENHKEIDWTIVRPNVLVDQEEATGIYDVKETLNPGHLFGEEQISRANVAHFMVDLLHDKEKWDLYKHKQPYIQEPLSN
jgi:putative NADH-flavin reductase